MSRFGSLVKAVFSQDMQIVRYQKKSSASKLKNALTSAALVLAIMFAAGYYAYVLTEALASFGVAELLPLFFVLIFTFVSLCEGIFKVQSLLFDCHDDDLLFSLPVPKSQIFLLRVGKFLTFQMIFNALFMVPVFIAYAIIMLPSINFYIFSALMLILTPLVPTAIAIVAGYLVRGLALRVRFRKFFQIILSFAVFIAIMAVAMNANSLLEGFAANAGSIADMVGRLYYPAGVYARLITEFNIMDLCGLLAVCILPLVAVIWLCSRRYFRLISLAKSSPVAKHRHADATVRRRSATAALVRREIARYFSSPIFVMNTLFGVVLLLAGVVFGAINLDNFAAFLAAGAEDFSPDELLAALPTFYLCALVFVLNMTSITSSAISIEGKSFNLTKSLPVSPQHVLLAKLLASLCVTLPIVFLCDLIVLVRFSVGPLDAIAVLAFSVLIPLFSGLVGLLVNLKYPKMNAASDAEVIKQSASAMVSVLIGMFTGIGAIVAIGIFGQYCPIGLILALVFALIDWALYRRLATWGARRFRAITI